MLVNLTSHPIHLYAPDAPDQAAPEELDRHLVATIPPSGRTARLATQDLGPKDHVTVDGVTIPVHTITHGGPGELPDPQPGVYYIVSRATCGRRPTSPHPAAAHPWRSSASTSNSSADHSRDGLTPP